MISKIHFPTKVYDQVSNRPDHRRLFRKFFSLLMVWKKYYETRDYCQEESYVRNPI